MKHILTSLILIFWASASFGQTPIFTAGVSYTAAPPTYNPGNTGSRWVIDTASWQLYERTTGSTWISAGYRIQTISGCTSPAYTPTKYQSDIVVNGCDSLYYYRGGAWRHLNAGGGGGGGIAGTGLKNRIAIWKSPDSLYYDVNFVYDTVNNEMGIRTANPERTLDVNGEVRIRDLTTDTPTRLVGADADGDLGDAGSIESTQIPYGGGNYLTSEADFTYNSTTKNINILGSNAGGVLGAKFRNTQSNGYTILSLYNNSGQTGANEFSFGLGGTGPTGAGPYADAGFIQVGSNLDRMMFVSQSISSPFEYYYLTNKVFSILPNMALLSSSNPAASTTYSVQNKAENGFTAFQAYNSTGTTSSDGLAFGTAGTSASYEDWSEGGYIAANANLNKLIFIVRGSSPMFFRTGGDGVNNTRLKIESAGNITNGNFTASARFHLRGSGATSATVNFRTGNSNDSTVIFARDDRRVGINTTTPDVSVDMGDNTDGLKLPTGTTAQRPSVNNTVRVNSDSLKLETRLNGTWETIASGLRSNKSLSFPSTAASSYSDLTITVTGAVTGDVCSVGVPLAAQVVNTSCTCFVSAADTVTVRFSNNDPSLSAGPSPGTFKVFVIK